MNPLSTMNGVLKMFKLTKEKLGAKISPTKWLSREFIHSISMEFLSDML